MLEAESRKDRLLQITDEIGRRTQYRYAEALLTDRILYEDGACTTYEYSEDNLRTRETGRTGAVTEWEYDTHGRLIRETAPDGYETYHTYDEAHDLVCLTPKGEETGYSYDVVGRRMSVENTYGTVEMSYNSRNFVTVRIDGEGNESRWFYDRMGNLTDYYPAKQWKEQAGGYRYDFLERLVDTITPLEEHHRQYRNFGGDIIRTIHPVSYVQKGKDGAARTGYSESPN